MQSNEPANLYNLVTIKNIDDEDFIFTVNKEPYLIKAGEVRNFPKFMVNIGLKHLIDKILLKRDPEGKLVRRIDLRDELASRIIIEEVSYEKPKAPTDEELVQQINRPTDLDRLLQKNKDGLKKETNLIPTPEPDLETVEAPELPTTELNDSPVDTLPASDQPEETFAQLEEEKQAVQAMPSKAKMLEYARDTLKMNVNDPKQKLDKMTAPELFTTLGLDKEESLEELGLI